MTWLINVTALQFQEVVINHDLSDPNNLPQDPKKTHPSVAQLKVIREHYKGKKRAGGRQNQQNDLCAQRRLASAQSDQRLRCPHEEGLGN